jgi:hypothetical protein
MHKRGEKQNPKRAAKRRARGRPSLFKASVAEKLCTLLVEGRTLRAICADASMPSKATVMRWLAQHEEFRDQYARAREAQADTLAEEVIEIADDGAGDMVQDEDGKERVDWENVNRSRLRVDARKWFASKVAPKRYGERISQELSGPGGGPIKTAAVRSPPLPPAEVSKAVVALIDKAAKQLKLKPLKGRARPRAVLEQIQASGEPLPPELYEAIYVSRGAGGE